MIPHIPVSNLWIHNWEATELPLDYHRPFQNIVNYYNYKDYTDTFPKDVINNTYQALRGFKVWVLVDFRIPSKSPTDKVNTAKGKRYKTTCTVSKKQRALGNGSLCLTNPGTPGSRYFPRNETFFAHKMCGFLWNYVVNGFGFISLKNRTIIFRKYLYLTNLQKGRGSQFAGFCDKWTIAEENLFMK